MRAGAGEGSRQDAGRTVADDAPVFVISVAAELAGMHAQTLRQYDRLGLVSPGRTPGGGRRYSARDIAQLQEVQRLTAQGIGLDAVKRVLELEDQVLTLQRRVRELEAQVTTAVREAHDSYRRGLVPVQKRSLVVWRPRRG